MTAWDIVKRRTGGRVYDARLVINSKLWSLIAPPPAHACVEAESVRGAAERDSSLVKFSLQALMERNSPTKTMLRSGESLKLHFSVRVRKVIFNSVC